MIDIASDLKSRFYWAAIWFFERHDMKYGVESGFHLEARHAKAVEILDALHDSVDIIPRSLIRTAEALRTDTPDAFERWLVHGVQVVGFGFYPTDAIEFVKALNNTLQREKASA
jgi:hypothetical protein